MAAAEGLEKLSKKFKGDQPISVIYGGNHIRAIKHYTLNAMERKVKMGAYVPYRNVSEPKTKIYIFDEEWKLVEEI